MATTELVQNTNGQWDEVPDAELDENGSYAPGAPGAGALRKSAFRSEQDANVYHDEVPITGGVVYVREMSDEHFEGLLDLQKSFKDFAQSATIDEEKAVKIEAAQPEEAAKIRAASLEGVQGIRARNATFTRELIKSQVTGWSFSKPYSSDAFRDLRGADQTAVIEKIMSASLIGRDDSDFLAPTSAPS